MFSVYPAFFVGSVFCWVDPVFSGSCFSSDLGTDYISIPSVVTFKIYMLSIEISNNSPISLVTIVHILSF